MFKERTLSGLNDAFPNKCFGFAEDEMG